MITIQVIQEDNLTKHVSFLDLIKEQTLSQSQEDSLKTKKKKIKKTASLNDITPHFVSMGKSGKMIKIAGNDWKLQSPDKSYSAMIADNVDFEWLRFEVNEGEYIAKLDANNKANGKPKSRSEIYNRGAKIPFNQDVWVHYKMLIEPGADIDLTNKAHGCYLGQWHNTEEIVKVKTFPNWAVKLSGQGTLTLLIGGNARTDFIKNLPATPLASVTVERGKMIDMTFRTVHSPDGAGEMDWYVDGKLVYSGKNLTIGYADQFCGYFKVGIYRTDFPGKLAVQYLQPEVSVGKSLLPKSAELLPGK